MTEMRNGMSDYFIRDTQALLYSKSMIPIMKEISAPLFEHTKITNFSYLKFNDDGTVLNLTTDERWIQFRFEEKIKFRILFKDHLPEAKYNVPYTYLWPRNTTDTLLGALHEYNIWNGCNIYIANLKHIEVFSFASSVENDSILNFYVNNLELLKAFIIYFKEQMMNMPDIKLKKNLISTDLILPTANTTNSISTLGGIYNQTKLKRMHLSEDFYLTAKEFECCAYLLKGKSVKSIAQIAKISPRTVESHINSAKLRANCATKSKLIDYMSNNRWVFDAILRDK